MSAGGAFGGARGFQPRPPEKGVFPLDHFGECKKASSSFAFAGWGQAGGAIFPLQPQHHCSLRGAIPASPPAGLQIKEEYLQCLKDHGNDAEACRELAKSYLQCRMERCAGRAAAAAAPPLACPSAWAAACPHTPAPVTCPLARTPAQQPDGQARPEGPGIRRGGCASAGARPAEAQGREAADRERGVCGGHAAVR